MRGRALCRVCTGDANARRPSLVAASQRRREQGPGRHARPAAHTPVCTCIFRPVTSVCPPDSFRFHLKGKGPQDWPTEVSPKSRPVNQVNPWGGLFSRTGSTRGRCPCEVTEFLRCNAHALTLPPALKCRFGGLVSPQLRAATTTIYSRDSQILLEK